MNTAPRLLFVPASGAQGAGEYYRCVAIARAALSRWPAAKIHFVVNAAAGYAKSALFATTVVQGSPTYNTPAVNAAITAFGPDIVVFDSAGRLQQLRHARRSGAATVYVSSRFKTRWKGFRLRRMHSLDQHWLAWPRLVAGGLTRWERCKLAVMRRPEVVILDPVHEPIDPVRARALRRQLAIENAPYALFSAGGGGYQRVGVPAPEIFARAALEVKRASGLQAVWVKGPNYEGTAFDSADIIALGSLASEQMTDLLAGARVAVISGGSLLLQAIALRTPAVVAPVAGDQPARIAASERQGAAVGAALDARALSSATLALLGDAARFGRLRERLRELNLGNGAEQAVDAMARLLADEAVAVRRMRA